MSRLAGPSHPTLRPTLAMSTVSSPQSTLANTASLTLARSLGAVSLESLQHMSPFDLFCTQIKAEHSETRVDAMRRCFVVANAMGADDTLAILMPFLSSLVLPDAPTSSEATASPNNTASLAAPDTEPGHKMSTVDHDDSDDAPAVAADFGNAHEQDDELLLLLAEQLGLLVTSGLLPPYRAIPLLPMLEKLASVEETVVRDKAVEAIQALLACFANAALFVSADGDTRKNFFKHAHTLILAMVKRLATADWFIPKVSAAAIIPAAYTFYQDSPSLIPTHPPHSVTQSQFKSYLINTKRDLRHLFRMLAEDETPMVRRAVAKYLANMAQAIARLPPPNNPQLSKYLNTAAWNNGNSAATPIPAFSFAQSYLIYKGSKDEITIKQHFHYLQSLDKDAFGGDIVASTLATSFSTLNLSNQRDTTTDNVKVVLVEDLIPIFTLLARDEQDSIRAIAVVASGSIGCALGLDPDLTTRFLYPVIKTASADPSWRVRQRLASDFYIVAQAMGYHENSQVQRLNDLVTCLVTLLHDFEAEVRTSAVENIARVAQLIASQDTFRMHISPLLQPLASDSVMEVRSNLALSVMECCDANICNVLNDTFIKTELKGIIETLLDEEYSEVQLRILNKLSSISHLLSKTDKIVLSILNMAKSQNWRVRESVAKLLPHLAESLGVQYFETQLLRDFWMPLLLDSVSDVRAACVLGMPKLLTVTGASWIQGTLLPQLIRIYDEAVSYLTRITILKCLASIASVSPQPNNVPKGSSQSISPSLLEDIVQRLLLALNDKIPNVRTIAIKCLSNIAAICDRPIVQNKIRPALFIRARDDSDVDCKFFAQSGMDKFI